MGGRDVPLYFPCSFFLLFFRACLLGLAFSSVGEEKPANTCSISEKWDKIDLEKNSFKPADSNIKSTNNMGHFKDKRKKKINATKTDVKFEAFRSTNSRYKIVFLKARSKRL